MKNSFKLFCITVMLFLVSSAILTGCSNVISTEKADEIVCTPDNPISTDSIIVSSDPQSEMQNKSSPMYTISEDNKSITMITKEYLDEFWYSNYEREEVHTLSAEEVDFIIQDSINIYMQYEEIILVGFEPDSSIKQVAERFPQLESQKIHRPDTSMVDCNTVENDIYTIIMYRLKALSSPKSFFTGEDAILSVGGDPGVYSSMIAWTTFYIPDYSVNTDRDYILSVVGQPSKRENMNIDIDKYSDLFHFCNKSGAIISFESKTTGQVIDIYPTNILKEMVCSA